jgi:enamine deaminase RidA (YjgF/YER057c/UK114 family)
VVAGPGNGFGYQSAGIRVGPLLWLSNQFADQDQPSSAAEQVENILEQIQSTCRTAGTDLSNVLRIRALVRERGDALAVYAAVKKAIPRDPPTVTIIAVGPQMYVSGRSVALDAVAVVEGT